MRVSSTVVTSLSLRSDLELKSCQLCVQITHPPWASLASPEGTVSEHANLSVEPGTHEARAVFSF